ncbi:uncharacterized protein PAC_10006 [Phialocephala subalpina]|uniref:C2H2-type domain-containing protein n=1 Tax=Phialocephala subalpina TaxID=576137 RepID=A0A1L7X510_9HELO|nr:uncharacterized protein PAC_10006 [Phialocephala subalpina]
MMKNTQQIGDSGKELLSLSCAFKNPSEKRADYISITRSEEKQVIPSSAWEPSESPTGTRSTPKHKTSHLKFLIWVAYLRNSSPHIDEIQRRTCPLIGCEIWCETLEAMLEHVYSCPALSKGRYRCPECEKEEPISRQHINGCQDSNTCKDWLANSFKCVKRRLSRRGLNKTWDYDSSAQSPVSPQDTKYFPYNPPDSCELFSGGVDWMIRTNSCCDTGFQDPRQELDSSSRLELGDTSTRVELACTQPQSCYARDDHQTRLYAMSPHAFQPQDKSLRATMAIAELDAWPGNDPLPAYFTDSGSSVLADHKQRARKPVYSLLTDHYSYLDRRRPLSPRDLPGLDLVNLSTLNNQNVASEPFLSPPSSSADQQRYPGVPQPSPTDSRASTSLPSMTRSPADSMPSVPSPMNDFNSRMNFSSDREKASAWSEFIHDCTKSAMIYEDAETFEDVAAQQELSAGGLSQIDPGSERRTDPINVASWVFESEICSQANDKLHDQHVQMPYHRALIHNEFSKASAPSSLARSCHSISKSTFKCVCGYAPRGKEKNKRQSLKRHQETCRVLSPSGYRRRPYTCSFQNCGRAFTRPDNLLVHQRAQGHLRSHARHLERTYTQAAQDFLRKEQTRCLEEDFECFLYHWALPEQMAIIRDRLAVGALIPFVVEHLRTGSCRLTFIMFQTPLFSGRISE